MDKMKRPFMVLSRSARSRWMSHTSAAIAKGIADEELPGKWLFSAY